MEASEKWLVLPATSDVNKDLGFKAKIKAKDLSFKVKVKSLSF